MGNKDGTPGGAKKDGRRRSRLQDVDPDVIDLYREWLHLLNPDAFADRLNGYREAEIELKVAQGFYAAKKKDRPENVGPDKRSIEKMYATRKSKGALVDTILGTFQEDWDVAKEKADEQSRVFEGPPRPVSLKVWPAGYPRPEGSQLAGPVGLCTREECEVALRKIIRKSQKPQTLWCSVAAGFWLKKFLDGLSAGTQPAVKEIVVRTLSEDYVKGLVCLELLEKGFWGNLQENLRRMHEKTYANGKIDVTPDTWTKMAPIHGVLYGDEVLFYGHWQCEYGGLNTSNGPVVWLTSENRDFAYYRDLLKYGDKGRQRAGRK